LTTLNQIKMKTQKMSLANIQGKMSRAEMKNIMAGSGGACMTEYEYECGIVRTPYPCCEGLVCVKNATNTGTLCMLA
jgi:hypothetical protein